MAAKSLVLQGIDPGEQGVLGGPIALAADQILDEQAALDMALELPAEAPSSRLSAGTLDGGQYVPEEKAVAEAAASPATLAQENEEVLAAARKVAEKPKPAATASSRYFIQPTSGRNWGVRHGQNAVDIANYCGNPVKAAAAGTVVRDSRLGSGRSGHNGGYGLFVIIKHPNGSKTRYAHLSKISVSIGEEVVQGQQIGTIGNTGNVRGTTGCHLHFEVLGATNPFVRS